MTDYQPKFKPGEAVTCRASAVIDGGQMVEITGSPRLVGPAGANSVKWFGVAAHPAAIGDDVTVFKGGVQRPLAASAIVAGDLVACAAAGRVATNAAPAAGVQVGIASTSQATAGQPVEVDFLR